MNLLEQEELVLSFPSRKWKTNPSLAEKRKTENYDKEENRHIS